MIVCVCNAISDHEIRDWVKLGGSTLDELKSDLGLGTCCGKCHDCAHEVLAEAANTAPVLASRELRRQPTE